jgi:hypothetical protein
MHRRVTWAVAIGIAASAVGASAVAQTPDDDYIAGDGVRFRASMGGYQENPSISTRARGRFRARVVGQEIRWTLRYSGIEGGAVTQAHIHVARRHVNGGISVWLCGNIPTTPAGVQPCPQSGQISGRVRAQDVVGPTGQGIGAGETNEVIRAMLRRATYANVHSATYGSGEIRGQILRRR